MGWQYNLLKRLYWLKLFIEPRIQLGICFTETETKEDLTILTQEQWDSIREVVTKELDSTIDIDVSEEINRWNFSVNNEDVTTMVDGVDVWSQIDGKRSSPNSRRLELSLLSCIVKFRLEFYPGPVLPKSKPR